MANRLITADRIYDGQGSCFTDLAIVLNGSQIVDLVPLNSLLSADLENYSGVICPGFINAHCHLELSHMKGLVDSGSGLIPFIKDVVTKRGAGQEVIQAAIAQADKEMWTNGIVAVGDISNNSDSFEVKANSSIHYHTFVEMFDFLQEADAQQVFESYIKVYRNLKEDYSLYGSVTPHAPYSVSKNLFRLIGDENRLTNAPVSIHNMETPAEIELFMSNSGELVSFYEGFGISTRDFKAIGKTSVYYAMGHMDRHRTTLMVHNTLCRQPEINDVQNWNKNVYWITCPSANLYIENRLPKYRYFTEAGAKIAIGTDSLTSNWQLSILEEMKVIKRFQSNITFDDLIKWATLNGAKALHLDHRFGSIQKGKSPGLNLLKDDTGKSPEALGKDLVVEKIA